MNKNSPTLSVYCIQDKNQWNFPDLVHDHNLCILRNGKIDKYLHIERITGQKYDNSLHKNFYSFLKKTKLLNIKFDLIFIDNILGRSCISEEGKIRFEAVFKSILKNSPEKFYAYFLDKKINAYAVNHELAHIYTGVAFFGMFPDNSLLMSFDGGSSLGNFSVWTYKKGNLNLIDFGWRLKYLSSLFNANALNFFILGIKRKFHNSFPGKFMGYAAYGKPNKNILQWLKKNDFFADIWNDKSRFFRSAKENFGWNKNKFDPKDNFLQNIAATVQKFFINEFLKIVDGYKRQTGTEFFWFSGGSALNISLNSALIEHGNFKEIFIPPVPNDAGLSIGAGILAEITKGNTISAHTPYLNNFDLECTDLSQNYNFKLIEKTATALLEGNTIAIWRDCAEAGPRALGNRSIIALPNSPNLAKKISMKIKGREWYRPIAPVMLEKNVKIVTGKKKINHLSAYMLLNFKILPQYRKELAGVIHVDGSARIQTIFNRSQHPFLYDLLSFIDNKFGIKALINTSFNAKGQPIVHTHTDATETAIKSGINFLILQDKLVKI